MNPGSETFHVVLNREDHNVSWGFRLTGGSDFALPLSIGLVNNGSIAERHGLKAGDGVLQINGTNSHDLTHDDAKYNILRSGNCLNLLLQRGAVTIWKPQVTQLDNIRPVAGPNAAAFINDADPVIQKTSLAANKQDFLNIGAGHNRTARGFPGSGRSSPQPGYSSSPTPQQNYNTAAQPFDSHGEALSSGVSSNHYQSASQTQNLHNRLSTHTNQQHDDITVRLHPSPRQFGDSDDGNPSQSPAFRSAEEELFKSGSPLPGFRSVLAPKDKPPSERKEAQYMTCKACGGLCVGVFVRIKGNPFHPECFKCASCSKNLKNHGHFEVDGRLYCEACASSAAQPPEPGMVAVPVYR